MIEGDETRAFVPGHVTGLFSIHRRSDAARTGSRGAGVTLTDGVSVTLTPADETLVRLNGDRIDVESVSHVLDSLDVTARVDATTDLPLGSGFGVSGAMALGTAYAANRVAAQPRSENALVRTAHVAEVEAGTGLGDVVAQARGGAPIRVEPGAPPHGQLDGVPESARVEYVTFGDLSTAEVLSGDTDQLSAAGEQALSDLREEPTLDRFMRASRRFAADAGLLTDDLEAVIEDVEDAGGQASMAMLGRTVFALGTGLSDAGYEASTCRIHPAGVTPDG